MSKSFSLQLQEFKKKAGERADACVGELVTQIVATVDMRSPVGNPDNWSAEFKKVGRQLGWFGDGYVGGRFRANWQLGINYQFRATIAAPDPDGRETVAGNLGRIPDDAAGHTYYLVNNLPYARRLENGYSKQAPAGILGRTVLEFQKFVDEAVGKAKAKKP